MDIKMNKNVVLGVGAVCLVLLAMGLFALVQQYSFVEGVTSITSYVPWGLYISLFLFFEAAGAGALLLAAVGKPAMVSRLKLAVVGVIFSACAGLAILPDLGRPLGMWRLFFAPNIASPLLLDVWLLSATLVFGVLLIVGLRLAKPALAKAASIGTGVFAVLLVLGTAIMFCSIPGKIGWESTAEIGISLVQMVIAGCAVALLLDAVTGTARNVSSKLAGALLVANAAIMLGEGMLLAYRGDFDDGATFIDQTRQPIEFPCADGWMPPAFVDAVRDMAVGETKRVRVGADEAYEKRTEERVIEVERAKIPADIKLAVGDVMSLERPDGQTYPARLVELDEERAVFDLNHDAIAKALNFEITLLDVRDLPKR